MGYSGRMCSILINDGAVLSLGSEVVELISSD
jgi:hypothetical protein